LVGAMRNSFMVSFLAAAAFATLGLTGCGASEPTSSYVNALTGAACTPTDSYMPRPNSHANEHATGAQCQGTGPGDNCDDLHSGKIDCIGDGNSGQGDDRNHECTFPQPGCDADGCCDGDMVDPPPTPPTEEPPTEPTPEPAPEPVPVPTQPPIK